VSIRIAVIEGDGIGREVIPAAIGVVRELGLGLEFDAVDVCAERFIQTGEALPGDAFRRLESADAILLGAIGDPRIADPAYTAQTLGRIRSELDLYANVRPARLLDGRLSPLRDPARLAHGEAGTGRGHDHASADRQRGLVGAGRPLRPPAP
jgi:3-isopropylmalate dehydrogenase